MKKVLYVSTLILSWIVLVHSIAVLLILTDIIPIQLNWSYTLGTAVAIPSIWLMSVGIVMLLRQFIYKVVFGTQKSFDKSIATVFVVFGTFWFAFTIGGKLISNSSTEKILNTHEETVSIEKTSIAEYDLNTEKYIDTSKIIKDIETQFITFCKDINRQLPVIIDDITTFNSVLYSNWIMSFHYHVEIDVNDYLDSDIKGFMREVKALQKQQIFRMFINGEYNFTQRILENCVNALV